VKVKLLVPGLRFLDGATLTHEVIDSVFRNFTEPVPITLGPLDVDGSSPTIIGTVISLAIESGALVGECTIVQNAPELLRLGEVPVAIIRHGARNPETGIRSGASLIGAFMSSTPMIPDAVIE
jgi:hypothetical protein